MTWPGLPSSLSGAYVIGGTDEEVQGRAIARLGKPWGLWYDDTTPDLERWLELGLAKYVPLGQKVMVCVPPGRPDLRYRPPVISVQEWYPYGMGVPPGEWGPIPVARAYCLQCRYPGTHGRAAPTEAEFERLLAEARAHRPRFVWLF